MSRLFLVVAAFLAGNAACWLTAWVGGAVMFTQEAGMAVGLGFCVGGWAAFVALLYSEKQP